MVIRSGARATRNAGLDVVRAIAIGMVLLSHCGAIFSSWYGVGFPWQLAVSGFYGVDLFFVLSGLLIGRLLIDIMDRGPTWRAWLIFMIRRWMRTLPLYFLWLAVLALVWPPGGPSSGHDMLWPVLPWYLSMTQNLGWGMISDWFAVSWSLTVEEWFYLLFSTLLFAAAAFAGRRVALAVTLTLFLVVPFLLRWWMSPHVSWDHIIQAAVIYRLDAIGFGVALAWITVRKPRLLRHWRPMLLFGVLLVTACWRGELDALPRRLRESLIFDWASFGFAACLPAAMLARRESLRWVMPAVEALSRQSYAMYITHLSLLEFIGYFKATLDLSPTLCVAVSVAAIYSVSYTSYRVIEAPIMASRPRQSWPADAGDPRIGRLQPRKSWTLGLRRG